jgi:cardiolipin synthase
MAWTKVDFLETGATYFEALQLAIAQAKKSIYLEFYIFRFDSMGEEILFRLNEAKARGLRVFLRVDGVGSSDSLAELEKFCERAKIEFEIYHPLPFSKGKNFIFSKLQLADSFLTRWRLINRRTHRKLVIIDDEIGFTGGMNVDQRQSEKYTANPWHDLSLRLEGQAIRELLHAFWFRPFGRFVFRYTLVNYNWLLRRKRNAWITKSIQQAQKRVWIITPYFTPPPKLLLELKKARAKGVDIRFILSRDSDVSLSRLAALGLYRKLLRWNISLFEFRNVILHRKLWIIDDVGLVGSTNFNHRSFLHDLELDIILREPAPIQQLEQIFLKDQQIASTVELEQMERIPNLKRILSWIAGWFSYWL